MGRKKKEKEVPEFADFSNVSSCGDDMREQDVDSMLESEMDAETEYAVILHSISTILQSGDKPSNCYKAIRGLLD